MDWFYLGEVQALVMMRHWNAKGAPTTAKPTSEIMTLFRWWRVAQKAYIDATHQGLGDEVVDQRFDIAFDLERRIRELPATCGADLICNTVPKTPEGIVALIEYALEDWGDIVFGNIWKDLDTKLFANAIAGAKRLAGPSFF